ncbi:hypothetical protein [Bradyrhizobium sp. CCBAU 51765]|uniref:hypothetical protein n=1 Tax=Bradyrhizobium sp. CCBAU 51765 TaxID=1325102 RepID=UPI001886B670|nr:hypothetical protein [Bradyrhizobium sp. CCBAU 51765]
MTIAKDKASAMLDRSFVNAMETATRLALGSDLDFRSAHNEVGQLVTTAIEIGVASLLKIGQHDRVLTSETSPTPGVIARAARAGGGPAPGAVATSLKELESGIERVDTFLRDLDAGWNRAREELRSAIASFDESTPQRTGRGEGAQR